uniref:TLR4 interactor with leucine rich repeats n=1 Tax=Cairina moschata TaxID=8855 RepID=A0A8C3C275_CAIMO
MGAPRRVRLMVLRRVLWGSVPLFLLLLPAAEPICPEPCDCQQHQHLLCTNRGLRSVPKAAEPQDILTYSLGGNFIANISAFDFHRLPNLLYLHLESNRIRWLSRGAFTGLAKLRFLDLSGNKQSSLRHPDIFGPLRSLHTLLLASNSLQQLTGGLFQHLPSLAKLSLSGNRLSHLAPDAFMGLGSLKELCLEGNLLSHLPAALLEPLSSLEALDLSRNALTALHPATFGPLGHLRELSLRDNALATLPGDIFASSPALYRLELEGNAWSCDCRLRGLKHWLGAWHSQGRLLTVFVQCSLPPTLAGKYLDYLQDAQLLLPPDGSPCLDGAYPSSASPPAHGEAIGELWRCCCLQPPPGPYRRQEQGPAVRRASSVASEVSVSSKIVTNPNKRTDHECNCSLVRRANRQELLRTAAGAALVPTQSHTSKCHLLQVVFPDCSWDGS